MEYYLAVDIGASTLRLVLGCLQNNKMLLEEVYRAPNILETRGGKLCWNTEALFRGIIEGLKQCKAIGKIPKTMGIDTWAVDYVLLDEQGNILGDSVSYRDARTAGFDAILEQNLDFKAHYRISGIAQQPFNTVYQLMAQFAEAPENKDADCFLMIPDYLNYLLTGKKVNEYTNCSSTAMLDTKTRSWSDTVLDAAGIPKRLFSVKPSEPGTIVGKLKDELVKEVGFDTTVLLPATHDTGSAFVAVPARDENAVFLSSGTWSLLGVEENSPITDTAALLNGFTNEGGYNGKVRFLKNIMGLWILQCIQKESGGKYSYEQMAAFAESADSYNGRIDVNDNRFWTPKSMTEEIVKALNERGFNDPSFSEILSCVTHSLAECYADAIHDLELILGRKFTSLNIVGGGSQNCYLNKLTAKASGLLVYAGPTEGTALGNIVVQMISDGAFESICEARAVIAESFKITAY